MKYVTVSVQLVMTEKEYESLRSDAILTAHGTMSEAIREALGWSSYPYGYIKWMRECEANAAAASASEGPGGDSSPREVAGG